MTIVNPQGKKKAKSTAKFCLNLCVALMLAVSLLGVFIGIIILGGLCQFKVSDKIDHHFLITNC